MNNSTKSNNAWRKRNPEKLMAHMKINTAIRAGKIIKGVCEVCGKSNTHAHHDDYSKPLNVRWLCPKHHKEAHGLESNNRKEYIKKTPLYPFLKQYQPAPERDRLSKKAIELREQGLSYKQIAEKLGKNKGLIYKWINPKPDYR